MKKPDFYIEGIPVYVDYLSTRLPNYSGYKMNPEYYVIHETENYDVGADAEMHNRYLHNGAGGRMASWHATVDDKCIYLHIPFDRNGWHAGDGNGKGNRAGIGIEHCVNRDGDFQKTVENGKALIRWIDAKYGKKKVAPHKMFSSYGKNCPSHILKNWNSYVASIGNKKPVVSEKPKPHPVKPGTPSHSNSVVDYLESIGENSSFENRKKLAHSYGIQNYTGSAIQNIELLDALRQGEPDRATGDEFKGASIVDYMNLQKMDSSFQNRARLAKEYGIANYSGTADQNQRLLIKIQTEPQKSMPVPLKVGQRVFLSGGASKYATGENIPVSVKNKTYTVMQIDPKANRVLLKEILSWVHAKDVGGSASKPVPVRRLKVGGTVRISKSAKKYSTGENIPSRFKGGKFTVQQISGNKVLLKELYSWINTENIEIL